MVVLVLALSACGRNGDAGGEGTALPTTGGAPTTADPTTTVVATSIASPSTTRSTSSTGATSTTVGGGGLSGSSAVDLRGLGPVRVGMTLAEASVGAGKRIVAKPGFTPDCGFADPEGGPEGVSFMVVAGRVARVDVSAGPVKTLSGAGVGDTEAQVQARYSNRLQASPHKYVAAGRYLTFVHSDSADAAFRLIFETDGSRVTRFRVGKEPEVSYVEGCS